MLVVILFFILLLFAWYRVEGRNAATSNGLGTMALGCSLFGFGVINGNYDKIFCFVCVTAGLFVALLGAARFTAVEVKRQL